MNIEEYRENNFSSPTLATNTTYLVTVKILKDFREKKSHI